MNGFCEMLKSHMTQGNSFRTFAATIDYPPEIVEGWLESQPQFALTKRIGEVARRKTLEDLLLTKQISLDIFKHLLDNEDAEMDAIVEGFNDAVLIQARERFTK
jgi:hypothetical protein